MNCFFPTESCSLIPKSLVVLKKSFFMAIVEGKGLMFGVLVKLVFLGAFTDDSNNFAY